MTGALETPERLREPSCPDDDLLERFLAGRLTNAEAEPIERHLEDCPSCLARVGGLSAHDRLLDAVRGWGSEPGAADEPETVASLILRLCQPAAAGAAGPSTPPTAPADTAAEYPTAPGYKILGLLGRGGMGVVYRAYDHQRQHLVALKTLQRLDAATLYRLKQEFRALADVTHPNLVTLYELRADEHGAFLTMELIDGVNFLDHVCPRSAGAGPDTTNEPVSRLETLEGVPGVAPVVSPVVAPVQLDRLRGALRQLAEGVAALHAAGQLHRDIKPTNVLVTPAGRVVLLDFGLATELDQERLHQSTEQGIVGTVAYMAPEQAASEPLTPVSDWYSVGVMLYEALTGRLPFVGKPLTVLLDKQKREPPPPAELVPGLPADLNGLCVDLLRRSPEARPSGPEVLRRLGAPPGDSRAPVALPAAAPPRRLFVGRERHLTALAEAFAAARLGRAVVVYVHGQPGVGKSALVQAFLQRLVAQEEAVALAGRCYAREAVPYKALDSVIDALCRYLRRLPRAEVEVLLPRHVSVLARVFPVLGRVEAIAQASQRTVEPLDRQELRQRAFGALRELLGRLAERRPLVVAIDDLQWGDVDSAALLAELLRPPDPPALLLVGSYRSDTATTSPCLQALLEEQQKGRLAADCRELAVEPLAPAEAYHLAQALLAEAGTAGAAQILARESEGNPYLLGELARYLQAGAGLQERLARGEPLTLDKVLWSRITKLPAEAGRLLEVVAVSGHPLRETDAYRAAELATSERAALAVLRSGHLVRTTGGEEHDVLESYHDRIRETVIAHLAPAAVQDCHRRLALALESGGQADPEVLAVHWDGAAETAQAAAYYARAADQAAAALAFDHAARLYRRALELRPGDGRDDWQLRSQLGDALANAGQGGQAAPAYLAAAAAAPAGEALELWRRAALQYLISDYVEEGLAALRTVLEAVGLKLPATPRRALLSLLLHRAQLWLRGLGYRERDTRQIPAADLTRIDICWSAALGLAQVELLQGADFGTRHLLLALRAGEPYRVARGLALEATFFSAEGGPAQARTARLLETAAGLARRIDSPYALGSVALSGGTAAYLLGRYQDAVPLFEQAIRTFRDRCTGAWSELRQGLLLGLDCLYYLGEMAELSRRLPLVLKEARDHDDLVLIRQAGRWLQPITRLAADDPDLARRELGELARPSPHQGLQYQYQELVTAQGQLHVDLYSGRGPDAWPRAKAHWSAIQSSLWRRCQALRICQGHLCARCALAAAATSRDPRPLLQTIEYHARQLERERMPWAEPKARLLRAGVAALRRDIPGAVAHLAAAAAGFDAVGMSLFAAAARRRRGQLLGGDEGRTLVAQADAWMTGQTIRNPARMTAMLAPGFPD